MTKSTKDSSSVLPPAVPWWPGLLLALLLAGTPVGIAQFDLLHDQTNIPRWLRDGIAMVGKPQIAIGLGLMLVALTMLIHESLRLRSWRREAFQLDPTGPDPPPDHWVRKGLGECLSQVRERNALDDIKVEITNGHDHFRRVLANRWLKYYVVAFGLPLLGFVFGMLNLRTLTSTIPFRDLFLPAIIGTVEAGLIMGVAVLLSRSGKDTLGHWQWLANQLAGKVKLEAEQGAPPEFAKKVATPVQSTVPVQQVFRPAEPEPVSVPGGFETPDTFPQPTGINRHAGNGPILKEKEDKPTPPVSKPVKPIDPDDLLNDL